MYSEKARKCQNASSKWKMRRCCVPRNDITQPVYTRDPKVVADELYNFFVSVGVKASHASKSLTKLHNLPPPADTTKAPEITVADKFQFHTVSTHEIRKIIMSFSSSKAPGHDKITMSVIKDSLPCILPLQTSWTGPYCHQFFHLIGKFLRSPRYLRKEIMRLQTITAQYCYSQLHRGFANESLWINWPSTWPTKRGWPSIREATRSCTNVKHSISWRQIRHVRRRMQKNWHL